VVVHYPSRVHTNFVDVIWFVFVILWCSGLFCGLLELGPNRRPNRNVREWWSITHQEYPQNIADFLYLAVYFVSFLAPMYVRACKKRGRERNNFSFSPRLSGSERLFGVGVLVDLSLGSFGVFLLGVHSTSTRVSVRASVRVWRKLFLFFSVRVRCPSRFEYSFYGYRLGIQYGLRLP